MLCRDREYTRRAALCVSEAIAVANARTGPQDHRQ